MEIKKAVGRKPKVTYKTMLRLSDAIQHNSTISEACRYAGISRNTYYSYLSNEVFAEKMIAAKELQNKVPMSFLTMFQNFRCFSLHFIEIDCQEMALVMQTNGVKALKIDQKFYGPLLGMFEQ